MENKDKVQEVKNGMIQADSETRQKAWIEFAKSTMQVWQCMDYMEKREKRKKLSLMQVTALLTLKSALSKTDYEVLMRRFGQLKGLISERRGRKFATPEQLDVMLSKLSVLEDAFNDIHNVTATETEKAFSAFTAEKLAESNKDTAKKPLGRMTDNEVNVNVISKIDQLSSMLKVK